MFKSDGGSTMTVQRAYAVAALALLLAPMVQAGPGHGGSSDVSRSYPFGVLADANNPGVFNVSALDGEMQKGDLFTLNVANAGPGELQVRLVHSADDRTVRFWTVPADRETYFFATRLDASGNHSLVFVTPSTEDTQALAAFDHPSVIPWSQIMPWYDSIRSLQLVEPSVLFRYTAEEDGAHAVTVGEPAAIGLSLTLYEDRGGAWPSGFAEIGSSDNGKAQDGVVTHRIRWDASAGTDYYLLAQGTQAFPLGQRPTPEGVYLPMQFQPRFGPAEAEGSPPAGLALLGVALLAAVLVARRRA